MSLRRKGSFCYDTQMNPYQSPPYTEPTKAEKHHSMVLLCLFSTVAHFTLTFIYCVVDHPMCGFEIVAMAISAFLAVYHSHQEDRYGHEDIHSRTS